MRLALPYKLCIILALAGFSSLTALASVKHEEKFPSGESRLIYYTDSADGRTGKEGVEREYFKTGKLKRETTYHKNAKQGTEKIFDEEGIVIEESHYADGRVTSHQETFESENENDVGRKFLINFNPLPLVLSAIVEKGLAVPASPLELGYRVSGYTGLMLAPGFVLNGAGGWGISGGLVIADVPGSWIGNMFAVRYGFFDITDYGTDWNITGSFYHNYAIATGWLWFWGVNIGWGLNSIEIVKSTDRFTGETRVLHRNLNDGFILGLNGGFGFDF
jgi:hypothetical protein